MNYVYKEKEKGFTLVEILIKITFTIIIMLLGYSLLFSGIRRFIIGEEKAIIQQDIRLFYNLVHKELRNADMIELTEESCENNSIIKLVNEDSGDLFYVKHNNRKITNKIFTDIKVSFKNDDILEFILYFQEGIKEHKIKILLNNYQGHNSINLKDENTVICYTPVEFD